MNPQGLKSDSTFTCVDLRVVGSLIVISPSPEATVLLFNDFYLLSLDSDSYVPASQDIKSSKHVSLLPLGGRWHTLQPRFHHSLCSRPVRQSWM